MPVIAAVTVCVLAAAGATAYFAYRHLDDGVVRSEFELPRADSAVDVPGEQNILIMGMDTRVDQSGRPLPEEVYQALHAGNAEDGGYNANVLILLHIPKDRSQAVGISIPRDNYVEIAGAPLGVTHSKIKEAYGLAMQDRLNELYAEQPEAPAEEQYQLARAAGRQAQIETVSQLLGDVRIDHFIEMSMGGFYYISEAVAPITVCLNQATTDTYSGADFTEGVQHLDAEQAMSFVRQRRDTSEDGPQLTDLDRARRQQAFLIALADQLREQSALLNPKTVAALLEVTRSHVALDAGFDAMGFLRLAHDVAQTGVRFVTLPIEEFGFIDGASVNIVDADQIQGVVAEVLSGEYFEAPDAHGPEAGDGGGGGEDEDEDEDSAAAVEGRDDAVQESAGPATATYESWDEPILAGDMPCVN